MFTGSWRLLSTWISGLLQSGLLPHCHVDYWSSQHLANREAEDDRQIYTTRLFVIFTLHGQSVSSLRCSTVCHIRIHRFNHDVAGGATQKTSVCRIFGGAARRGSARLLQRPCPCNFKRLCIFAPKGANKSKCTFCILVLYVLTSCRSFVSILNCITVSVINVWLLLSTM